MQSRRVTRALVIVAILGTVLVGNQPANAHSAIAHEGKFGSNCYYYGKLLAGKVQVVTTSLGRTSDRIPTYKVQIVSAFPDLKVQVVDSFPNKCGQWKFVNSFPDFKVRFVTSFPDFKVKWVNAFPGLK